MAPRARTRDALRMRFNQLQAALWALIGAPVALYLFLLAIGGVNPHNAPVVSLAVSIAGLIWLAHAGRRLWAGGYSPVADRERRGF
jgi:hypothetical protein